jgi:hypothetical protein
MAQRQPADPEHDPRVADEDDSAPSVKEPSEADEKLDPDQEVMQPDSS